MNGSFASRRTYELSTATDQITSVAGGEAVTVNAILISGLTDSNSEISIRTTESTPTTLFYYELDKGSLISVETPFLADKGIEIVNISGDSLDITVFHSNPGL